MPGTTDFPDFSSAAVRAWFWSLLRQKSFDPSLKYPGDFLWLDEPDDTVTPSGPLADGRSWEEDGNAYFFYEHQAVGEGWDATFQGQKRPYVMMRGGAAGSQRWGTVWSGDIEDTYDEMKLQIRGMLAAGLSAFPFWAHDAGGFKALPSDAMYRQWAAAFGSFTPMWKPHGIGLRFPWQFSQAAQDDLRAWGARRMALLPYVYTAAWRAASTGLPMARAMVIDHRTVPDAWKADQEYMWGDAYLVAPNASDGGGKVSVWLPPGGWYDDSDETKLAGGGAIAYDAPLGKLPLFVKAGAIVMGALPTLGTKFWDRTTRVLDVYAGADGAATQFEDDGVSDKWQTGARALTKMTWIDAAKRLDIAPDDGTYPGAPMSRTYRVRLHGLDGPVDMQVNGAPADSTWDAQKHVLSFTTALLVVTASVAIERRGAGGGPDAGAASSSSGGAPDDAGAGGAGSGPNGGCGCEVGRARASYGGAPLALLAALGASVAAFVRRGLRGTLRGRSHRRRWSFTRRTRTTPLGRCGPGCR
jgi:alpha-D-xyloside xylohydrolase